MGPPPGSWAWDKDLGSAHASPETLTSHTVRNIRIDAPTIEGYGARNGPLRLGRVDPLPAEGPGGGTDLAGFEGAEGFGATTAGGRGGWIVKVANLDDSGVGSLRWALGELAAPRIVVFDVGGGINLKQGIQGLSGNAAAEARRGPGFAMFERRACRPAGDARCFQCLRPLGPGLWPGLGSGLGPLRSLGFGR